MYLAPLMALLGHAATFAGGLADGMRKAATHPVPLVGLLGDTATFVGGAILAVDAVLKERDFKRLKKVAAGITSPFLARVTVKVKGLSFSDENDVERAFIHHSVKRAAWGCVILTIGFLLLACVRFLELWAVP